MWTEPEPPPEPGAIPAAQFSSTYSSDPGIFDFDPDALSFQTAGDYYVQASFKVDDNVASWKYYGFCDDGAGKIVAGCGGFVEGNKHTESFTVSFIYSAGPGDRLYFRMIDLFAGMSGTWSGLTVNAFKI